VNAEELIAKLKRSFNAPSEKDERLKVVLICIIISTTFWFFNALNQAGYTSQINYPVEWEFDQENFIAVGNLPEDIQLEVSGGGWDLMARSFGFSMRPIRIALTEPAKSNYLLTSQLRAELSRNLEPVVINFLLKDSLRYNIQPIVTRQIALSIDQSNLARDANYRLAGDVIIDPPVVEVFGPEELVLQMSDSMALAFQIEGKSGVLSEEVQLPQLPPLIQSTQKNVSVSFEVLRLVTFNESVAIDLVNFKDQNWTVVPNTMAISYQMIEGRFEETDSTRIVLSVDYNKWNPQDSTVQVEVVKKDEAIENLQLSSQTIKIYRP